jgi:internalin A
MPKLIDAIDPASIRIRNLKPGETSLDLSNCGITQLKQYSEFFKLIHLKILNLSRNFIRSNDIELIGKSFPNLKKLIINESDLSDDEALSISLYFRNLDSLEIGGNHISEKGVTIIVTKLKQLRHLELYNTRIHSQAIESISQNLKNLETLGLEKNNIGDIGAIKISETLSKLTTLNLAFNGITDNAVQLITSELTNLRVLNLCGNSISNKGAGLIARHLKKLEWLHLGLCDLSIFGVWSILKNLNNLQSLNLDRIKLGYIEAKNIPVFQLNLKDLSAEYASIGNEELSLITKGFKNLTTLNLAGNHFGELGALMIAKNLVKVKKLIIPGTEISQNGIEQILNSLSELEYLDVSNNPISKAKAFINHKNLNKLVISDCKINDCPSDVWQSNDLNVIKSYFEQIDKQDIEKSINTVKERVASINQRITNSKQVKIQRKRDVKLVLLGNSNAGKTTLVKYLMYGKFEKKRKTTHGLEVLRWEPDEKKFPLLQDVTVSIWDFGGQDYYHEAYKVFLSSNALFLVLWCKDTDRNFYSKEELDSNSGESEDLAHYEKNYWLNTVRFYGGYNSDASVFLLQTKTDLPGNARERIAEKLHKDFLIAESFSLGLQKSIEFGETKEKRLLDQFIKELELVLNELAGQSVIPDAWLTVRQELWSIDNSKGNTFKKAMNYRSWVDLKEFSKICVKVTEGALSNENSSNLPIWLERGGSVLLFRNNEKLKNRIFLEPKKLADEIYKYFEKGVRDNKGELRFKNNTSEDIAIRELLIDLDLIVAHPDSKYKDCFIVPQYLPDKHPVEYLFKIAPKDAWKTSLWFKVPMFYYKRVLNGLLFNYAKPENDETPTFFWKHAVIFVRNGLRVMIKGQYPTESNEGIIQISIESGEGKAGIEYGIFRQIQRYMIKEFSMFEAVLSSENKSPASVPTNDGTFNPLLYVSADGLNFIDVAKLPAGPQDLKEGKIEFEGRFYHVGGFASLLNFKPEKARKVFLSYSHQNSQWLYRLKVHLAGLRHSKFIEDWTDQEILPGEKWNDKIMEQIEKADVFILLLSADFVASKYIWETEFPAIKSKIEQNGGHIIYVLIEPFDYGAIGKISENELIPKRGEILKAVSSWENKEEALETVAKKIRSLIENVGS